jgi:hypothetical protein
MGRLMAGYVAERVAVVIAEHGEAMTLTRPNEVTSITLKGKRVGGGLDDVGNADQQSFRVLIGTAELLASDWRSKAPSAGGEGPSDALTVGGRVRTVLDVKPRGDGDVVALYELEVAG